MYRMREKRGCRKKGYFSSPSPTVATWLRRAASSFQHRGCGGFLRWLLDRDFSNTTKLRSSAKLGDYSPKLGDISPYSSPVAASDDELQPAPSGEIHPQRATYYGVLQGFFFSRGRSSSANDLLAVRLELLRRSRS